MVSLSNWLARLTVNQVPYGLVGSSPTGTTKKTIMEKRSVIRKLMEELTPEKLEEMKQERIEHKNSLTLDYQLGVYVGFEIINRFLPTLSTDMIQSRVVIDVSNEDTDENDRLDTEWYETTRYGGKWDGVTENGDKTKWDLYHNHNKMLEKKYLPHKMICHLGVLNIQNMDEFKSGLRTSLWDCDMCSYNIEPENIKIYDDEDVRFTIIEFTLDSVL